MEGHRGTGSKEELCSVPRTLPITCRLERVNAGVRASGMLGLVRTLESRAMAR